MFAQAIKTVAEFTRPIHSLNRNFGSTHIQPGAATLFFVNSDGWALTCSHVAKQISIGNQIGQRKAAFLKELNDNAKFGGKKQKRKIENKYGLKKGVIYDLRHRFMDCVQGKLDFEIKQHPTLDVALIHFMNYDKLLCNSFPIFHKDASAIEPGNFVCRIGFPFVEFTNYEYDSDSDSVKWTSGGRMDTPRFPIEGMITRIITREKKVIGFELSRPGLRGQSGGPVFDTDAKIIGMQSATAHLDLNFDVEQDVIRKGKKKKVKDHAFLHVGQCIHVNILKNFMNENEVEFQEG